MYSLRETVHLFIVNCLLKNMVNIQVINYLHIKVNTAKPNFHAKNIIWLKFTVNYSLFKFNYNWRHCSAISLTVIMLFVCAKSVCVRFTKLVCKAMRLAFSCQTSVISFPFIPIPWVHMYTFLKYKTSCKLDCCGKFNLMGL